MYPAELLEPTLDLPRVSRIFDELGTSGRVDTVRRLEGKHMAALYEAAKGFRPLTLEALVPSDVEPGVAVVHEGHNSLPLFSNFQKRFCKSSASAETVAGYNQQTFTWFTGPGYFVARASTDEPGAIDFDYRSVPTEKPASWPAIVPNRGLRAIVYGGMVDVVRSLSEHVSIGRAWRRGKLTDEYFVICRT
jgi:hypothetical protein